MIVNISLDIRPDEVALATELLATLRALTEHVGKGSAAPVVANVPQLVQGLIARAADESQHDQIASELAMMLNEPAYGGAGAITEEVHKAYDVGVLNNPELNGTNQGRSVAPFIKLLKKMPEAIKVKDNLIKDVLSHLTKKRPIGADRTQFFAHAEAFAILVNMEFVSVDGAAQTMERLMAKPDSRTAAVTMLGKTVEHCQHQLLTKCNPEKLTKLLKALEGVTEKEFEYDKDWVLQTLYTSAPQPDQAAAALPQASGTPTAGGAGAPPRRFTSLTAMGTYEGHSSMVFTIAYDAKRGCLVSASRDNTVRAWNRATSQPDNTVSMPEHYVCSMDVLARRNLLLTCCVSAHLQQAGGSPPAITAFDAANNYAHKGMLVRSDRSLVTCLRCMPDTDGFATGESFPNPSNPAVTEEAVCYYDLSQLGGIEGARPLHTFRDHEQLVTCVVPGPSPHIIISGSRDNTIRVWDLRAARCCGSFGNLNPATGKNEAHQQLVTSMDITDNLLISSSLDVTVGFWDMRGLSSGTPLQGSGMLHLLNVDGHAVLKVVGAGAPAPNLIAASTVMGLYMIDVTTITSPAVTVGQVFNDVARPFKPYHDIKWGAGSQVLYGCSENSRIDLLVAQ